MRLMVKLGHSRRGVGSILGAAFLILILLSGYTSYTLYIKQVGEYTKTLQDMQTYDLRRNEENIEFISVSTTIEDKLNLTVKNTGSNQAHLIWLGILDETTNTQEYYKINYYINPSETVSNIPDDTITILEDQERVIQLVTELGNTFIYSYLTGEGGSGETIYDFVDETCGSSPIGTHSFFEAQQYGPDGICDTLTEENTGETGGGGWLSGWQKRLKISVDHNDVDSNLTDFPLLLYLSTSSGIYNDDITCIFDDVGINRKKIALTTSDGTTQCYVEIEEWDAPSEEAWLWVKVPSISNTSDTGLYLYYDNTHSDNTDYVGDTGSIPAEAVWDSNFTVVQHLHEVSGTHYDSTSNGNDGTPYNGITQEASGKIDGADYLDGSNDYISYGDIAGFDTTDPFSMFVWVKSTDEDGQFIAKMGGPPYRGYQFLWWEDRISFFLINSWSSNCLLVRETATSSPYNDDAWHQIGVAYTGSGAVSGIELYVDGQVLATTNIFDTLTGSTITSTGLRVGRRGDGSLPLAGTLDEVRISHMARSTAWIKAAYESERDNLVYFRGTENYELNLEVQWVSVDFDEANEWLCIYGGTMDFEDILVDVWNGTDWVNVLIDLESGWNSVDISSYLVSSTFIIRYKGGLETSDSYQDSWEIDATFLHVWT